MILKKNQKCQNAKSKNFLELLVLSQKNIVA